MTANIRTIYFKALFLLTLSLKIHELFAQSTLVLHFHTQ